MRRICHRSEDSVLYSLCLSSSSLQPGVSAATFSQVTAQHGVMEQSNNKDVHTSAHSSDQFSQHNSKGTSDINYSSGHFPAFVYKGGQL